jgi:hypothetical protein
MTKCDVHEHLHNYSDHGLWWVHCTCGERFGDKVFTHAVAKFRTHQFIEESTPGHMGEV